MKTIFVCPPADAGRFTVDRSSDWVNASHNLPIDMPTYASQGLFFRVDDTGRLLRSVPIGHINQTAVSHAIWAVQKNDTLGAPEGATAAPQPDGLLLPTILNYKPEREINPILKFVLIVLGAIVAGFLVQIWQALQGN
jgi:hypothetical protein